MPKLSTRGLNIYMSQAANPAPADTITNVTNAAPAVVTPATIGNYSDGDIVWVQGTDFEEIDDQPWVITNVTGTTFELQCSDTSAQPAAATTGVAKVYKYTTNLTRWCLTSYSYDQAAAETIDLSTFCGTESASGQPQPASYSVAGFSDGCEEGFQEMMKALKDAQERMLIIQKPSDPPSYVMETIDVSSFSESYELNAGISFTSGGAVKAGPWYRDCASCITYTPVVSAVAGSGTTTATITFSGGPADASATVTLTATGPTGAITGLTPVAFTKGATVDQIATAVAAELDGKQDATTTDTLVAVAAGGVVTVTESGGGVVTVTAVIA